jgi:hypothetical protein
MPEQAHTDAGDRSSSFSPASSRTSVRTGGRRQIVVGCKQMIEADVPDVEVYERTLRQLAGRYSDHPDYREEWRP